MKIALDIRKSVDENASAYFEKAKKSRKKIDGVLKAISMYEAKLSGINDEKLSDKKVVAVVKKQKKLEWFEKYRWFVSSEGFLVIAGRDSTTNEIIIKKNAEKHDVVFHTDMAGSPFVVIKNPENKKVPESTLIEASSFTAAFSRGWKQGMASVDVFYVAPEQVSKQAKAGESLPKGAFMIYGDTRYVAPVMRFGVGIYDNKVMGGPLSAIEKNCKEHVEIAQGNEKLSDVAKEIKHALGGGIDEILRVLPAGCKTVKDKRTKR